MISTEEVDVIRANETYREYIKKSKTIIDVLLSTKQESPYLESFNSMVRELGVSSCREGFKEIFEKHRDNIDRIVHRQMHDDILPQPIMVVLIADIDSMFKEFYQKVLEKETSMLIRNKGDFDKLKLSPKLLNLIPKNSSQLHRIYELCITWVLKIEYNWDLIERAKVYGLVDKDILNKKTKKNKKREKEMPQTIIKVHSLNNLMKKVVDKMIENIFSNTVSNISKKVNKFVIGFLLASLFGATMVTIGGIVVSFVDLPFEVDYNIFEWAVDPIINIVKKQLNIGDDNISAHILQEAIYQTELINNELEELISSISQFPFGDCRQIILLNRLDDTVQEILYDNKKISNIRLEEEPVISVPYVEHKGGDLDGWLESYENIDQFIEAKEQDEDGFYYIEMDKNIKIAEGPQRRLSDEFVVVKMDEEINDKSRTETDANQRNKIVEAKQMAHEKSIGNDISKDGLGRRVTENVKNNQIDNDLKDRKSDNNGLLKKDDNKGFMNEKINVENKYEQQNTKKSDKKETVEEKKVAAHTKSEGETVDSGNAKTKMKENTSRNNSKEGLFDLNLPSKPITQIQTTTPKATSNITDKNQPKPSTSRESRPDNEDWF